MFLVMSEDSNSLSGDDYGEVCSGTHPPEGRIDPAVLDLDSAFIALSHPRRRYVVYALSTQPTWSLHSLAETIDTLEQDATCRPSGSSRVDRIYTSLYHFQVPKLVEHNVIKFDTDTEQITRGPQADRVIAILEGASNRMSTARSLSHEAVAGSGEDASPE